ncbi:MAG: hypothetical protein H7A46_13345 [Verrucomicrobiales bacterium]|nr:hypothetical protein [Verrucomicrobiales bacterium]
MNIRMCVAFLASIQLVGGETSIGGIEEPGESITSISCKVVDFDNNDDGKTDRRIKSYMRGGRRILVEEWVLSADGRLQPHFRAYMVDNKLVLSEYDENLDGVFETFYPRTSDGNFEVFERKKSGEVTPYSGKKYKELLESADAHVPEGGQMQ